MVRQCSATRVLADRQRLYLRLPDNARKADRGSVSSTNVDADATARMIVGASCYAAQWIANADDPVAISARATAAYRHLLDGLLQDAH